MLTILNMSYLVPTAHCTDVKIEVRMLSHALGSGKA